MNKLKKILFLLTGSVSLGLGVVGVFIPILPTTPFLLLSAYLFAKSSKKAHEWLRKQPFFGKMIIEYQEKGGMRKKVKVIHIVVLWISILATIFFIIDNNYIKLLLIIVAVSVTIHLLHLKIIKS